MSGPRRLSPDAPARFGTRIDRDEPVGFRFGGRPLAGLHGDTLATALFAAGVTSWTRSPTLGRPRGLLSLGLEDAQFVALEREAAASLVSADAVTLREGMSARVAGSTAPRLADRLLPSASAVLRALPAPRRLIERLRRVLPLPQPRAFVREGLGGARWEPCDVAIVGSGLAGLAAATAARSAGLEVRVIEAAATPGGIADLQDGRIDGLSLSEWAARRAGALRDVGALRLCATAIAIDPDGVVTTLEYAEAARPGRASLRLIDAKVVVLATGRRERPLVFADNDRPGVLMSVATRALLRRYAVAPGERVVVATLDDDGYRTAIDLKEAGVTVAMILDPREDPQGPAVDMAKALGVPVSLSSLVAGVEFDEKRRRLTGVRAVNRYGEGVSSGARVLAADALVMSGGFAPRDELARRSGLGDDQGLFAAIDGPNPVAAVAAGWAAGSAAASRLGASVEAEPPRVEATIDEPAEPIETYLAAVAAADAGRAFVDFNADVTCSDFSRAVREGAAGPQALARRLALGLGADGGRASADLAAETYRLVTGGTASFPPAPGRPTLGLMAARGGLRNG